MKYLFIHQNFPGQFKHIAKELANDEKNEVIGLGDIINIQFRPSIHPRIKIISYKNEIRSNPNTHHYIRDFENHIRRAQSVTRALFKLKNDGFTPNIILVHPGWGEAIFLRDIYPDARVINYFEYYYHATGGDVGFDKDYPTTIDDQLKARVKNSTQLLSLASTTDGISPTNWQKNRYPDEYKRKISVIHEGIDTDILKPDYEAWIKIGQNKFHNDGNIVTYVSRNLEPYRGFHSFMRSIPLIQKTRPNTHFIIVGGDNVSYGRKPSHPYLSYKQQYTQELENDIDWTKVHFIGKVPYDIYLKVLQISSVHIYLTYPFVLSWSMLEAMSVGCIIVGSNTGPVQEVIEHNQNGLLVDFFNYDQIADTVINVLSNQREYKDLRIKARQTIIDGYDLKTICLPNMISFLQQMPL